MVAADELRIDYRGTDRRTWLFGPPTFIAGGFFLRFGEWPT
jgi:hypothetical protein